MKIVDRLLGLLDDRLFKQFYEVQIPGVRENIALNMRGGPDSAATEAVFIAYQKGWIDIPLPIGTVIEVVRNKGTRFEYTLEYNIELEAKLVEESQL